jgi:hypothetical protein
MLYDDTAGGNLLYATFNYGESATIRKESITLDILLEKIIVCYSKYFMGLKHCW